MSAQALLQQFQRVMSGPDAVERLRRFVLELAVAGRLVEQRAPIGPAPQPSGTAGIASRALPPAWGLHPLSELLAEDTRNGYSRRPDEPADGTPILRISAATGRHDGVVVEQDHKLISAIEPDTRQQFGLVEGDLLACRFNGNKASVGRFAIYKNKLGLAPIFPDKLIRIRVAKQVVTPEYLRMVGDTAVIREQVEEFCATTVGNWGISAGNLKTIRFPVPPLEEQHRIVAKVDELMVLCDRLEIARAEGEAARDRLAAASLARLSARDPETFANDARFALDALLALTTRPDQIELLRRTILNLAVRGGLASLLAQREEPVALGTVAKLQNGYAFKSEWFAKSGVRLLRNTNVAHGVLDWHDTVHLPEERTGEFERFNLREGDVVLSLDRPFIATGTKVATVSKSDLPALLLQRVGRFVIEGDLDPSYLLMWINSPHFAEQIDPGRSNGVPHVSSKQVESAKIFLPNLDEQRRVVAKVRELMALCDQLEADLRATGEHRSRLLEKLLHDALDSRNHADSSAPANEPATPAS